MGHASFVVGIVPGKAKGGVVMTKIISLKTDFLGERYKETRKFV